MKTIRTNCFETNSSSTHSFTIHAPSNLSGYKPSQTILPNEDGTISVPLTAGEGDNSMMGKLSFLLNYAYATGNQVAFDKIKSVVESFTKATLVPTKRLYTRDNGYQTQTITSVDDDVCDDSLSDEFYSWTNEYGNGSVSEFRAAADEWLKDDQSILLFIFSNVHPFSSESHYDG